MSASALDYETVREKYAEEMQAIAAYNAEKEVLLVERENRDNLLEQHYPYILSLVDDHRNSHWVPNEVKLDDDLKQWAKLSPAIKTMVKRVLIFFLKADSIVLDNAAHFCDELQFYEFRTFLAVQEAAEAVHGQVYSNLLLAFVSDHRERAELIKDLKVNPALLGKSNWANAWKNKDRTFQERVTGFSKVEGISFQAAFAVIYWLKERGLLPGLCASNEWIARDESYHATFGILLSLTLEKQLPEELVHAMTRSLVEAEKVFCDWLIPEPQIGLNAVQMHLHLQFIADRHLQRLGYTPLYNVENPFPWTERRDYPVKTDFFVKIVTSYQLAVSSRSIAGPAGEANNTEVDAEDGAKKDVGNVWAQIGDF